MGGATYSRRSPMRVLLKEGATEATAATILLFLQPKGALLETLSGESAMRGVIAEVDPKVVGAAVSQAARERNVRRDELLKELEWIDQRFSHLEPGRKVDVEVADDSCGPLDLDPGESR
jgi:hypothetical protein